MFTEESPHHQTAVVRQVVQMTLQTQIVNHPVAPVTLVVVVALIQMIVKLAVVLSQILSHRYLKRKAPGSEERESKTAD